MGTRMFDLALPNVKNTKSYFDCHRHENGINPCYSIRLSIANHTSWLWYIDKSVLANYKSSFNTKEE